MVRVLIAVFLISFGLPLAAQTPHDISQKPWVTLKDGDRAQLIYATRLENGLGVLPSLLDVAVQPLDWNPAARLVRVTGGWRPRALTLYFVQTGDGTLIHLDGSFAAIQAVNAASEIHLTPKTIGDYVWFTGFFVRSDQGPFLLVETARDAFLPPLTYRTAINVSSAETFESIPSPLRCELNDHMPAFSCAGTVFHAKAYYAVNYQISPDGFVDMSESSVLAKGLGGVVDAPIDPRGMSNFLILN